jgi:hypothetical protein
MKHAAFWEDDNHYDGEYIRRLLWNVKVRYRIHKSPSMDFIPNKFNPVNKPTLNFLKLYYNILLTAVP